MYIVIHDIPSDRVNAYARAICRGAANVRGYVHHRGRSIEKPPAFNYVLAARYGKCVNVGGWGLTIGRRTTDKPPRQ